MAWRESRRSGRVRAWLRPPRRARPRLATALVVIAAAVLVAKDVAGAGLAIGNARRLAAAMESVIHTQEVQDSLQQLQRVFNALESRQRGFLLTGAPEHLAAYRADRDAIERHLRRIEELTADDPAQRPRVDIIRGLLVPRIDLLEKGVRIRLSQGLDPASLTPTLDAGERLMEVVRAQVQAMIAAEGERLPDRERASMAAARAAVVTSTIGLVASIALVFGAIWLLDRRAREEARATRATAAVIRAAPDAVVLIEDGRVSSMSGAAEALFRKAGRALPVTLDDFLAIATPPDRLRDALLGRKPDGVGLDAAIPVDVSGVTRRILPRAVPVATGDSAQGVLVVLSDVTELARLDEMRSDLVAAASHELRTPVTTLRMSLLMLGEGAGEMAPRMRALVETALVGVQQLLDTVDELLDMTRIEAGRMRLSPEPLQLGDVAREAADRSRARADELGLRLQVDATSGRQVVLGDRARLRIVAENLVRNALKYTPPGGTIELMVSSRGGTASTGEVVELAVTDSGRGVPEEYRARVFEKFFRVEHYRHGGEREPRGAGIGLYISREIVELHGGTIRCEAAPTGRGARFVVALPAAASSRSPGEPGVAGPDVSPSPSPG